MKPRRRTIKGFFDQPGIATYSVSGASFGFGASPSGMANCGGDDGGRHRDVPDRVKLTGCMSRIHTPISDEMADYIRAISLREPDVLRAQRESTDDHPQAGMQTAPEQGQFLNLLARLVNARRTLEVGVFLGYSSTCVALALPPDGKIIACDVSEEYTARARRTWQEAGVEGKIDLRIAPALETLDALIASGESGTFDFAFIDADKKNYENYYERALVLVRRGGLIVIDNVLWHGTVIDRAVHDVDTEAIRAFNRKVHQDARVSLSLVPLGDGLTLACKL
jgi:caffeoyl-CoA O-methyltransferase